MKTYKGQCSAFPISLRCTKMFTMFERVVIYFQLHIGATRALEACIFQRRGIRQPFLFLMGPSKHKPTEKQDGGAHGFAPKMSLL